jgi:hypothetical protein
MNDTRYSILKTTMDRVAERVEETTSKMVSQSSLKDAESTLRKDIKVLGDNINTIMEHLKPKAP